MKNLTYITCLISLVFIFSRCQKQRFLPDPHNPGLSMLTDQQTNTGTCYINDVAYINYWPAAGYGIGWGGSPYPRLSKVTTTNAPDSIELSWQIGLRVNGKFETGAYNNIAIRIPALQGATFENFWGWNEKRFSSDECALYINYSTLKGTANIYFVKITTSNGSRDYLNISGLFDGNIGDSILVKKGRFDFTVETSGL